MSKKLNELRESRGKLVHDAREILNLADAEKRSLTEAEDVSYKDIFAKQEQVRASIEREEGLLEIERSAAEQSGHGEEPKDEVRTGKRGTPEYRAAFVRFISGGNAALTESEVRALQSDSNTAGGYTVAPEQFVSQLIKSIDNQVFIRNLATKFQVPSAQSLGAASLDADPADADWTTELSTGTEDSTMSFGKRELTPHVLTKLLKVSTKLLRQNGMMENLVRDRLAYKFAVSQEKGFLTGTGANQPLGVFTASALGISTGRDVSTGNATTAPTFDGLISAKFALKGAYWGKAQWVFHRDVLAVVAKLKNGEGDYIWRESVRAGEPDRLLNMPVNMSEYAPNTLTTGQYVGLLGDFSNYWIADSTDMQIQRLVELYAATAQVGFIGRLEADGMPVLEEAFSRVKLA